MVCRLISAVVLALGLAAPLLAEHDQGQGKSQDGKHGAPIATASEPLTAILFGTGLGLISLERWRRRAR